MKTIKVFSTFTGVGSPEMALRNLNYNYESVGISEVDKYALIAFDKIHTRGEPVPMKSKDEMVQEIKDKNIAYNFSSGKSEIPRKEEDIRAIYEAHIRSRNFGDIRRIDASKLPDFDLFTYSFPCKNLSIQGKREGLNDGKASSLLWECKRIIEVKKPKLLLMENVKNLVSKKNMPDFQIWIEFLKSLGYTSEWETLNANMFGVPQSRERVIMTSTLGEHTPALPKGKLTKSSIIDIAETNFPDKLLYSPEQFKYNGNTALPMRLSHVADVNGVPHCGNRIYSAIGYAPTLNSMNGGNRQPKADFADCTRRLSSRECWRLMGYSDFDYDKVKHHIPDTKMYERSGRGIVVPMLESVFMNWIGATNV